MQAGSLDERLINEIRAEMARRKVSQTALAKALPLSPAALSRRLCGRVPFSLKEIEAVARVLQVTPSKFLRPALATTEEEWSE